jgi:hypothetical protein
MAEHRSGVECRGGEDVVRALKLLWKDLVRG